MDEDEGADGLSTAAKDLLAQFETERAAGGPFLVSPAFYDHIFALAAAAGVEITDSEP